MIRNIQTKSVNVKMCGNDKKNESIWRLGKTDFCIWHLLEAYWITIWLANILISSLFMARQPLMGQVFLTVNVSRSHSDTLHSVGLHWARDRTVAETYTWQRTTLTADIHAPGWIRTRNPSKGKAAHSRLRPCGHWNRSREHTELKKGKQVTAKVIGLLFALLEYSMCQFL